ncbi:mandelate racemase/muconate lactonizing protein [Rhizobium sp. P38BS-XIX]|uniref:enolase C-terminal domain-like protein n=1 Tax=Rhizobium sp. P38BS-XIX TaxID=2726740 RepID=UPI0014563969|nr:enolase C-terminal domain-like protein [Rhizobium sp. P38BS-XIX]NLS00119.1 mandelate racemase/muconate lactonizing protein [Rhizobium sp. P38BS-XIX]
MRISEVRLRQLQGTLPTEGDLWEERLVRPVDVYPEFRNRNDHEGGTQGPDGFKIATYFVEIHTDEGVCGLAGPIPETVAFIIAKHLRKLLVGQDAIAGEKLWDQMHRAMVHGRQGDAMLAISAVDCALWDLRGKWLNQPVYRLLGGPTQTQIPAYASMLGFSVLDLEKVHARAIEYKKLGYRAQKWFFRHGPMSGAEGLKMNVELVRTLREAVGEDYDLMFDCWQAMDVGYVVELASRIEKYRPKWLEECVMPDRLDSYAKLRERISIPLSGAEHEYTRWGFKRFLDVGALDVIQPDIYWCGGLTETLKIAAYATAHDVVTIPHGHSSFATAHFSAVQSPIHTPYQEYLVKWNAVHQHFLVDPLDVINGMIEVPERPGLAMEIDDSKIEQQAVVFA